MEVAKPDDCSGSVDPFMLQRWYPHLTEFTAPTRMLALDRPTAVAMMKACEERRKKGSPSDEQQALLRTLLARMEAMMTEPCFVKLGARSCKDSILRAFRSCPSVYARS
jgi:hypothetical protein